MPRKPAAHPGTILRDVFLAPIGMSPNELAAALHLSPRHVDAILKGNDAVTAETALRLSRYFGTTPKFWMTLQAAYELGLARQRLGLTVVREVQPRTYLKWSLNTTGSARQSK